MFSGVVELPHGIEKIISSLIRFEIFYDVSFGLGQPLFALDSSYRIETTLPGLEDRKVSICARTFAVADREGCGQQVKTGVDSVDDNADLDAERERKRCFFDSYDKLIASLRIALADNAIWLATLPLNEALLKDWDVGFGPLDSGLGVQEIIAHGEKCPLL